MSRRRFCHLCWRTLCSELFSSVQLRSIPLYQINFTVWIHYFCPFYFQKLIILSSPTAAKKFSFGCLYHTYSYQSTDHKRLLLGLFSVVSSSIILYQFQPYNLIEHFRKIPTFYYLFFSFQKLIFSSKLPFLQLISKNLPKKIAFDFLYFF